MNILLVHAHHEPQSFSSALARQAAATLEAAGHTVTWSDLPAMGFNPFSGRNNFTTVKNPDYLKQQVEEMHATENNGFAPELEAEIRKLEACDALIFSFPLWWFGMPAILKGWVDRVYAMGRIYGGPKLYENGTGQSRKRAMVLMTTGGGPVAYSGHGFNPSMETVLTPIHHGIFWFNGFLPLDPFIAWSPVRLEDAQRKEILAQLDRRLATFFTEEPRKLPPLADFPEYGADRKKRLQVIVTRTQPVDDGYRARIPAEQATVAAWIKDGRLLSFTMTPVDAADWRAFLTFRAEGKAEVNSWLQELPLAPWLEFQIHELSDNP
ncbi:MAG: NAD(P)H-dependent oxidoreductase [Candidatus Methylacidiphilales bacterium]|nr:NAD(P)H-dependent oxidoreductase [Candidatus Methylacidiphilales bacterium]